MRSHSTFSRERRGLWKDYRALLFFGTDCDVILPFSWSVLVINEGHFVSFASHWSRFLYSFARPFVSPVYRFLPLSLSFPVSLTDPCSWLSFSLILKVFCTDIGYNSRNSGQNHSSCSSSSTISNNSIRNTTRSSSTRPILDNIRSSFKAEHHNSCQMNTQETSSLFVSTMI